MVFFTTMWRTFLSQVRFHPFSLDFSSSLFQTPPPSSNLAVVGVFIVLTQHPSLLPTVLLVFAVCAWIPLSQGVGTPSVAPLPFLFLSRHCYETLAPSSQAKATSSLPQPFFFPFFSYLPKPVGAAAMFFFFFRWFFYRCFLRFSRQGDLNN